MRPAGIFPILELLKTRGFQKTEKYNDNEHAELYFELVLS